MADTTDSDALKPMTDGDVGASGDSTPADPLKGSTTSEGGTLSHATQTVRDKTADLRGQATDKARLYAEDGKARATGALEQLARMLTDAAGQVDEKIGAQYGQYARTAADKVQGFSTSLNDQSIDDLADSAREFVRKSPAVAIGAAAALGFVVARLLTAGLDQRDKAERVAEGDPIVEPDMLDRDLEREPGLVDLFGQLATDARDVARAEAGLVKARAIDTLDRYKTAAILLVAAAALGFAVVVALMVGLILTLAPYVGAGPATLIVAAVFGALAILLGLLGKGRLSTARRR